MEIKFRTEITEKGTKAGSGIRNENQKRKKFKRKERKVF